jgi:hypothetical protein
MCHAYASCKLLLLLLLIIATAKHMLLLWRL